MYVDIQDTEFDKNTRSLIFKTFFCGIIVIVKYTYIWLKIIVLFQYKILRSND